MNETLLDTTSLIISTDRRMWYAYLPGRVVFGNGKMRSCQIVGGKLMHTGLKSPNEGVVTLTPGNEPAPSGGLGVVKVVQVFYRSTTNERSLAGPESAEVDMAGMCLAVVFDESTHSSDKHITHHEFYVQVVERGGWYRIGSVPYVGDGLAHSWEFPDVSVEELMSKRPLEDQLQASLYPAVSTATYWNGGLYGAGLEGRRFEAANAEQNIVITLTQGSNQASITNSEFTEADLYKPVMQNGEPVFYIWKVFGPGSVEIKLPYSTSAGSDAWDSGNRNLTFTESSGDVWIGAEEQTVYVTPTYVGEAGNGLTRGLVMWNPLNQLRDEYQASVGSRITAITRDRENLVVFFDKAIVIYQGEPGLDVPQPRAITLSDCIGTLAQHHVWRTRDGSVWWLTRDRIFTLQGQEAVDVTASWGNASLFDRHADTSFSSNYYNWTVTYNARTDQTLIANLTEPGYLGTPEATEKAGQTAFLVDHGRKAVYKLRFPVRVKAVATGTMRDGGWKWFCLAVPVEPEPEDPTDPVSATYFGEMFVPGGVRVDIYGPSVGFTTTDIDYSAKSGVRYGGHIWPLAQRFIMEFETAAAMRSEGLLCEAYVGTGNARIRGSFTATTERQVSRERLITDDQVVLPKKKSGTFVQYRWSGTNTVDVSSDAKLLSVALIGDEVPKRGIDE